MSEKSTSFKSVLSKEKEKERASKLDLALRLQAAYEEKFRKNKSFHPLINLDYDRIILNF